MERSNYKDNLELKVIQQESEANFPIKQGHVCSCTNCTFVEQHLDLQLRKEVIIKFILAIRFGLEFSTFLSGCEPDPKLSKHFILSK